MWDTVEVVHCAIDGIDNPLEVTLLIAGDTFFAVEGVIGEFCEQDFGEEILCFTVEG